MIHDVIEGVSYARLEEPGCPLCGALHASRTIPVSFGMTAAVAECAACRLAYQTPRPSLEASLAYMEMRWRSQDTYVGDPEHQRARAAKQLELLALVAPAGARVLDFGAGIGTFARAARAAGWDAVPQPGEDLWGMEDYRRRLTRYYFFQPRYPFLLRAWKNRAGLENRDHAGHLLSGEARWYPRDFPLRHYIFLSETHARRKYLTRQFDEAEVGLGWHRDKLRATSETLWFPGDERMHFLPRWSSKHFDAGTPFAEHYWEWALPGSAYALDAPPAHPTVFRRAASAD